MAAGNKRSKQSNNKPSSKNGKKKCNNINNSNNIASEDDKKTILNNNINKLLLLFALTVLILSVLVFKGLSDGRDNNIEKSQEEDIITTNTIATTKYTKNAKLLAEFINNGSPLNNNSSNIQQLQELIKSNTDVLGELVLDESTGYRIRTGSFLELLNETPPRRIKEDELLNDAKNNINNIDKIASLFRRPLIIERSKSRSMSKLSKHLTVSKLKNAKLTVKPSRCSTLALNYGLFDSIIDKKTPGGSGSGSKTINPMLQPNHPNYKGVSFTHYMKMGMDMNREEDNSNSNTMFDLTTSAVDDKNIQIQTHGIQSHQLPHFNLQSSMAKHEFKHSYMDREYFPSTCINPPALGMAGSLRGLRFHNHPANWNESIIGRKLWLLYPTRDHVNYSSYDNCPWPPWSTTGEEENDPNKAMKTMMDTFFISDRHTPSSLLNSINEPMKSCHDQTLTSLQWIVYEMPKLQQKHRPILFIAHPNEVVWIPDGWIHATLNIDDVVHAYRASCMQNVYHGRTSNGDAYKDVVELCKETDKFCPNRDEYCHSYCQSFDGNGRDNIICNVGDDDDDDGSSEEL